jgi:NifU-like protein involved in Fe-S cluster formation
MPNFSRYAGNNFQGTRLYRLVMDEVVIKYYRKMCREGFKHTGELKNPTIFLDTVGEKFRICAHISHAYINLYIVVRKDIVTGIKYLCTCDPTANVAVEILCGLIEGKTLAEVETLTETDFAQALGTEGEEYLKKARGLLELLHRGISRYRSSNNV